jgi:uncharacterized membrane protein YgcG
MKSRRIALMLSIPIYLAVFALIFAFMTACSSVQGTRQDYFGYRNAPPVLQEDAANTWSNPLAAQQGRTQIAYVPVITPWYDYVGFGPMFGWSAFGGFGFNRFGFGWNDFAYSPWNVWNSPFGWGSSFYCPVYGFSPFAGTRWWGRPFGWNTWGNTTIVNVFNNNVTPVDFQNRPTQLRDFGTTRPYAAGVTTTQYLGNYDGGGYAGGRSRDGLNIPNSSYNGGYSGYSGYNGGAYKSSSGWQGGGSSRGGYDNSSSGYSGYNGGAYKSSSGWQSGGGNYNGGAYKSSGGWQGSSGNYGGGSYRSGGGSSGGGYSGGSSGGSSGGGRIR